MKVCANCKHYSPGIYWYSQLCLAVPHKKIQNPVTGKIEFHTTGHINTGGFTTEKHAVCRDINPTGNCSLYKESNP